MSNKLTSKINAKAIISFIPTVVFACFILTMAIATSTNKDVQDAITSTQLSADSLEELSDTFEETLQDSIYQKNNYINLNGLSTRLLGINTLNERYKLANGYLAYSDAHSHDTTYTINSINELNTFLADRNIDFLYILAPGKDAFYDIDYSPGYSSDAGLDIDSIISGLNDLGVTTLDMNAWFADKGWTMEDTYYKTDHHWLPQAGLEAARATMELLFEEGLVQYDESLLSDDSWTIVTLDDWFLGSHGKRVGIYYAGLDDITVYYPNFETDYTYARLRNESTNWNYYDFPLNLSYLNKKDYFNSDPNSIYLYGGSAPLQIINNTKAVNDMRILVVGDSFNRSTVYFLTSQFSEIYSIDLRYYTDGSFAQYVEVIQPDLVIMLTNTYGISSYSSDLYIFGVKDYISDFESTNLNNIPIILGNYVLDANDSSANFSVIYTELEPGQTYTLTVDSTDYSGGSDLFLQMTLQDLSTNEAIYNRYFDANSLEEQKWIFDVPDSNDTYAIYLYAGTKGNTSGVSAEVTGITLYEGIIEW